jgi:hypothetical protein
MATVVVAAILLTVFRFSFFMGLVALLPLGLTSLISRLGPSPSARRHSLWLGASGTVVLPFLAANLMNYQVRPPVFLPVLTFASLIPTLPIQGFLLWAGRRRVRLSKGNTPR